MTTTEANHSELIEQLLKPGRDIAVNMDAANANLIHLALGIAGEAGELVDCIKKAAIYGQHLDMQNLVEEMGDLEFYLGALRQAVFVDRETILKANINKLRVRYGHQYSDTAAQMRADKKQRAKRTSNDS